MQTPTPSAASGIASGLMGTAAMTAAMHELERLLPAGEHEPAEPRQILDVLLERCGLADSLADEQKARLALVSHFGYGAAMGALYGFLGRRLPFPRAARGAAFGLAVWAASYLGWLPALRILPPPHNRPTGRNGLLIATHLIWGATTALAADAARAHPVATSDRQRRSVIPRRGGSGLAAGRGGNGSSNGVPNGVTPSLMAR